MPERSGVYSGGEGPLCRNNRYPTLKLQAVLVKAMPSQGRMKQHESLYEYRLIRYSCPNLHAGSPNSGFLLRNRMQENPRMTEVSGGGCVSVQSSQKKGKLKFRSSMDYTRSELQQRASKIPVRKDGPQPAQSLMNPSADGEPVLKVWKLIRPKKQLSLTDIQVDSSAVVLNSKASLKSKDTHFAVRERRDQI